MKHPGKKKYDRLWIGLVGAVVLTIIGFFIFFAINKAEFSSFNDFINTLRLTQMFSSIVSLSALPNLLLFFIFIWTHRNRSAKGVLTAIMLITILVAILRFS